MKKLSEEKIREIKALRRRGLTHREIAKKLNIAHMTAYYYTLDTKITSKSELLEKKPFKITFSKKAPALQFGELWFTIIQLPFSVICPRCKKERDRLGFCFDWEIFICECGEDISLRTVQRKKEFNIEKLLRKKEKQ